MRVRFIGAALTLLASCTCDGEAPPTGEAPPPGQHIIVRLLDALDAAQIELGALPQGVTTGERSLLEHNTGDDLGAPWVALDGGGRPVRTEVEAGVQRLFESACAILPAAPNQELQLEVEMTPDRLGPPAGPGRQRLSGLPLFVELDEAPATAAEGCQIDFLVTHSVAPHQDEPEPGSEGVLPRHEISCTTAGATRAVAVVLATGLVVGFTGRTQVSQQPDATARLGRVRLVRRRLGGMTLAELRSRYTPDPLVAPDAAEVRVKPRLDRQLRDAVAAPPGTSICWPAAALRLEPGAVLRVALGVAWHASVSPGRPVSFAVRAGGEDLLERVLQPGQEGWVEQRIPLGALADGTALCLETRAEAGDGALWSFWGTPEVLVPVHGAAEHPRTVVLISIDTLRADRLGLYGYRYPTSPVLDELARSSLVFENHVAQTGWTLPSHVSMLTGLSPEAHGVTAQMDRVADLFDAGFDPSTPTLAAALREQGYSTYGVASGPYLDPVFGFDRGFDTYDFVAQDATTANAHERSYRDVTSELVVTRAQRHLRDAGGRPVFLFLHFWDVHYDYIPSRSDLAAVHPARAVQNIDYTRVGHPFTGHLHPSLLALIVGAGPQHGPLEFYRRVLELLPRFPWVRERMAVLSDLYDGEVHTVDRHLGLFFQELRRQGRDDAVIAVTGDHGEAFMEHGTLGHGLDNIHAEGLIVPLIVRAPGLLEPGRRHAPSSTRDVSATLLDLAGVENLGGSQGRSLRGSTDPDTLAVGHDGSFSRIQVTRGTHRMLVWGRFGRDQLFDLARDPLERTDIGDQQPGVRGALRHDVARYLLTEGRGVHVAVSGDPDITPCEVTLESEAPLRPFFVYGPPDTGSMEQQEGGRVLRLRAHPAVGEVVSLIALVPDIADVRVTVVRRGQTAPEGSVVGVDGRPLPAEVVLTGAAGLASHGSLPPGLGDHAGRVCLWRTSTGQVRQRLEPDEETMEQLRALGYIRGRPRGGAEAPADAEP